MEFGENIMCVNNNMHMMREQSENTSRSNSNDNSTVAWYSSSWQQPSNYNNYNYNCSNNSSSLLINAFHTAAETTSPHHHPLYGGCDGSHVHPDPHLTCLKLGKRHYFEDTTNNVVDALALAPPPPPPREKSAGTGVVAAARCQVEGCQVALVNSKEYHRRHKVCEMHSKAPKVVVLGREQRFCQQCSRFHVVSEFDESKRSCRRRLAGHNERRRKTSHSHSHHHHSSLSVATNNYSTTQGCALSLLSPAAAAGSESWLSDADLSIRCSAALHELIAQNRAALVSTRQQQHHHLVLDRDHWHVHQNHNNNNNNPLQDHSNKEMHHPEWGDHLHQSHY